MQKEFYLDGQIFSEGETVHFIDCTSRGSGQILLNDTHKACVECVMGTLSRKVGKWIYYYKAGNKKMEGTYAVLDLLGIPNVRHGIWNIYHEDGSLFQQIAFECGEVREIHFFDMNVEIV